jgi:hypothetical protein
VVMRMATKNDNARVIEPDVIVISGKKTIIDRAYPIYNSKPSFKDLNDAEFMKIIGVVK